MLETVDFILIYFVTFLAITTSLSLVISVFMRSAFRRIDIYFKNHVTHHLRREVSKMIEEGVKKFGDAAGQKIFRQMRSARGGMMKGKNAAAEADSGIMGQVMNFLQSPLGAAIAQQFLYPPQQPPAGGTY